MTAIIIGAFIYLSVFAATFTLMKLNSYERRKLFLKTVGRKRFLKAQQLREANLYVDDVYKALDWAHGFALDDPKAEVVWTVEALTYGLENLERAQSILRDAVAREERFIPRMTPKEKQILEDIMEWIDD